MSAAWLTSPIALTGMRMFECDEKTPEECDYYKQRWHFWYIADYVFALPTVALFMSVIGIFIIGHCISLLLLRYRTFQRGTILSKSIQAHTRGFGRRWAISSRKNRPEANELTLVTGMDLAPKPYYWADELYGGSPPLATRSGWLALGCMPFVFATASKTNWVTLLTGVSHERLQVFHRWIAYAFFVLALLHTFPFIVYHIHWKDMQSHFTESLLFYWTGIVALCFQAWLTFMSHSTIRSLGYEFFKVTHFASVIVFMLTFFWHCDYTLTSWHYFIATAAIYVPCFVYPWLRTIFEYKWTQQAHIFIEDNGFMRITISANFDWTPGQHCFLRFTGFGVLYAISSHPFTICSSPSRNQSGQSELVFYIRHQGGFTKMLHQDALDHLSVFVPVLVDGPYGGVKRARLRDVDHHLLIAGGSGAGWCLPFIEQFIHSLATLTEEQDSKHLRCVFLRVILATRDTNSRIWFERTVDELLTRSSLAGLSSSIQVQVYLTGEAAENAELSTKNLDPIDSQENGSSNSNIRHPEKMIETAVPGSDFDGRPRLPLIVREEAAKAAEAHGSLGVYVCGPITMQNDVRNAVAAENLNIVRKAKSGGVHLHSEYFSWA
ncbi:Nn.00g065970.m01.CDS01 [Neocucurbitaria sp. VM-36]